MAQRLRGMAWERTPLGPPDGWDPALRTLVPILLSSNQPMFVVWGEDRTLLYNDGYGEILGQKHPQALGRDFLAVWSEIRADLESIVAAAYRGEPVQMDDIQLWMERKGYREETHFSFFYSPVRGQSGGIDGFFCACTETTAEVLASERVQLALEAGAIIGTWVWTVPDNRFIADERFAASFDLDPEQCRAGLPLEVVAESIHPDDWAKVERALAEVMARGGLYRCEYRVRQRGGNYRWIEANGRVEMDEAGRPVRFPGVLLDIEGRRRVEAERDQATALLKTFIDAVPGVVYAKDREGRLLVANRGTAELVGRPPEDFIGKTDREILADPAVAEAVMALDRRIMETGVAEQVEEWIDRPDGTPVLWWSTKAPLRDADGNIVGLIGSSVDITDRKRAEEALRLSEQALREADRRKDDFLAMLAHELRNPLAPISTASQMLRLSGDHSSTVTRASEIIARQVVHLTRLVDDLLDVSRVTRGLVELDREPVDVRAVVAAAVEQARPLVQSRGHELRMALEAGQAVVRGDFHRLVQVVSNLLNNAAKYTPQGGVIEIRLGVEHGDLDGGGVDQEQVVVQVSDNGAGIPADLLPRVFDLFTQAERTPDRAQGGLGIGLALVRSMVQLHGGRIEAASAGPNQGSTFTIRLPRMADRAPVDRGRADAPSATTHRQVLIVDDNVDAAATLAEMLQLLGHQVATADGAQAALDLAANGARWDTCILDIGLPDMTGYELGSRLRQVPGLESVLLIALTGYGQAHDRAIARRAGFDHHMVKPPDIGRLVEILDRR